MRLIKIASEENGGHSNQTINGKIPVPDGWAIIPEEMEVPESFPFVGVEAQDGVVTRLTPGVVPEAEPEQKETVSTEDVLKSILGG